MTARQRDENGFITVRKNPISKVGVFPYLGKSINRNLPPDKIFWVYRPAEELSHPETLASFRMVPIIEDHTMLGEGFTPAEEKGVEGVTGENVELDGDTLYADLKIFSENMKQKVERGEKTELSMGYRVGEWDPTPGTFNGQFYDFVQRKIRGNHIALVDEGRMGREVAVLDGITFDSMEISEDIWNTQPPRDILKKDVGHKVNKPPLPKVKKVKVVYEIKNSAEPRTTVYFASKSEADTWVSSNQHKFSAVFVTEKPSGTYDENEAEDASMTKEKAAEELKKKTAEFEKLVKRRVQLNKESEEIEKKEGKEKAGQHWEKYLKPHYKECDKLLREIDKLEKITKAKDTASDEQASPTAETTGDADTTEKGNTMADEEKKAMTMDEVKAFIKGHAKDRKTFDKLMDEMRPAEDESAEEEAKDAEEEAKDSEEKEKGLDATIEDKDEEKEAQDAAISGLRAELTDLKKNGIKTLMSELNKRNAIAAQVEEVFGTFDHAEKTAEEVAAYGLKKAGITAPKGHESAVWAGFIAGRKANRSVIGGQVAAMDRKEHGDSLVAKTLQSTK